MKLDELRGVGPRRLAALREAGITDLQALTAYLPRAYRDTTADTPLGSLREDREACVAGRLTEAPSLRFFGKRSVVRCTLADASGTLALYWFNQPWRAKQLKKGEACRFVGRVDRRAGGFAMVNPAPVSERGILPLYRPLPGLPSGAIRNLVRQALEASESLETLPDTLLARHGLLGRARALRLAHLPSSGEELALAKRRLAFENLLLYQTVSLLLRREDGEGIPVSGDPGPYLNALPFRPTGAQRRAIDEIARDLQGARPMRRLLQGDVGSGKTCVVFAAAWLCARSGYQTALMAPTELLARQHLESARRILSPLGVQSGLLLGGLPAAERRGALEAIRSGEWQLVIGTQALLSPEVEYAALALVAADEQHRFGVRQRRDLGRQSRETRAPHVLALSATPIPRTLALVLYGDLDISVLNEVPPGRLAVKTRLVPEHRREGLYRFIRERAAAGEQAFIVCARLEEEGDARGARSMHGQLARGPLRGLRLGLVYGPQPSAEKEEALLAFARGETDVLVATSVVEVGIDVPGATVMVVEDADRFGLAQLHQLRGRVGRGEKESWCFLMAEENERLQALCGSSDGFALSRRDLELRGPGEFLGARQHGKFAPGAFGVENLSLLEETLSCARELFKDGALLRERERVQALARERYAVTLNRVALH